MSERVVLARRTSGFQAYQWTGEEPESLADEEDAVACGAQWEGDELVTYDLPGLRISIESASDDFLNDND